MPTSSKARAGLGSLGTCSGCGHKVEFAELEYEVEFPTPDPALSFRFHAECYRAWLSSRIDQ